MRKEEHRGCQGRGFQVSKEAKALHLRGAMVTREQERERERGREGENKKQKRRTKTWTAQAIIVNLLVNQDDDAALWHA